MNTLHQPAQSIALIDLEGVLMPEIWLAIAEHTGIDALCRTTRDEPDYGKLMDSRLAELNRHSVTMSTIREALAEITPFNGARQFLQDMQAKMSVVVLSDTFEQLARPLIRHLGWPALICHSLVVEDDRVLDYRLRLSDQKLKTVTAFQSLNYRVVAAGDSYNDTSMLAKAEVGVLFRAPDRVQAEYPGFPSCSKYEDLFNLLTSSG